MLLFLEDTYKLLVQEDQKRLPKSFLKQHQNLSITIYLQKKSFILFSPIPNL